MKHSVTVKYTLDFQGLEKRMPNISTIIFILIIGKVILLAIYWDS